MIKVSETKSKSVSAFVILSAFEHGTPTDKLRENLTKGGVAKGTVSKIVTVLNALRDGTIVTGDVTSLNHAYSLARKNDESKIAEIVARIMLEGNYNNVNEALILAVKEGAKL